MSHKIAFAGFRHGHVEALFKQVEQFPELDITAVCEEDAASLEVFKQRHSEYSGPVYTSFDRMLREADCEIVVIGDYYGKRGSIAIRALQAGKHVIGDKPLCTSLEELDQIEALAAEKHLSVGCMLDLRTGDCFVKVRELVQSGVLGELMEIQFSGQHSLMESTRPHWYFEEGKHGGTINDIAIHAFDYLPWMSGLTFDRIVAARTWHTPNTVCGCFQAGGQLMVTMSNGCGVMGDVSYAQPSTHACKMPQYWRFTIWGTKGVLEFNYTEQMISLWIDGESEPRRVVPEPYAGPCYLDWFMQEVEGRSAELSTSEVLASARMALSVQKVADESRH